MDRQPDMPPRRSITPWIAIDAVGAALGVLALMPGMPKAPMLMAAGALLFVGTLGVVVLATRGD